MAHYRIFRVGVREGVELPTVDVLYYAIDSSKIDSTLTDFTVGIKITSDTNFMNNRSSSEWQNIHVVDESETECYVEVDKFDIDNNKEAVIWVKVPSVSSSVDTILTVSMGTSNASYVGQVGDSAAQGVWDAACVYHMSEDPSGTAPQVLDSTDNEYHLTSSGTMLSGDLVDDDFGSGIEFDASDDYLIRSTTPFTFGANFSIAIKFNLFNLPSTTNKCLIHQGDYTKSNNQGIYLHLTNVDFDYQVRLEYYQSGWRRILTDFVPVVGDNAITLSFNSSTLDCTVHVNGDSDVYTIPIAFSNVSSYPFKIGVVKSTTLVNYFDGRIDEVYVYDSALSDDLLKAIHNNLLGTLVSSASITAPSVESELGLEVVIGAFRELNPVGISEEIGFNDEVGETEAKKGGKYFGTLQNDDEDPTGTYDSPTVSDYWYSFDGVNDGIYWDTHLDPSDLDFKLTFRLDYSDILTDISTAPEMLWQCGSSVNGIDVTVVKDGDNMSYLQVTFALSGVDTQIRIMLHNLSLDTWYEMFVNSTTLSIRERDNPTVGWTVSGTLSAGDVDYYEAFGYAIGTTPSCSSGSAGEVSIREIEYFGKDRLLMPTGLATTGLLKYSAHYGTNNDGDAGKVGASGTPVVNADWVTFASSAAYYLGSSTWDLNQTDVDVYLVFRLEEDHLDTLKEWHTIWKTGNEVNGLEIGIDGLTRRFGFVGRNDSTLKENVFSIYNLELDVWYEIFCTRSKMTIREEATPANGFTQSAIVDVDVVTVDDFHALATSLVGHVWEGSAGSGWQQETDMSVKKLQIYKSGELTFPADLATPAVGPQRRWTWGSDVGGKYSWSQVGTVTVNTDNVEGDGNDGLYNGIDIVKYYPKPSTGWGIVVEFEADSFASAATIWKTGDEVNGAEIGIDASGNIGFYGRSSSTLTSMYIDTSVLSTATKYFIYATASDLKIYDSVLSLVAEETGTVTTADSSGSSDNASVLVSIYGSPMTGGSSTWQNYLDGRLYTLEIWEEDDLTFPPSNWHHSEAEIGLADEIGGDVNTAIMEVTSTISFTEETGGELISHVTGTSEGIGFDDTINVIESQTNFSEATIGFTETIGGEERSIRRDTADTIGFSDETGADHIDESSGELAEGLGFADETGAYNSVQRKESASILGLNDESFAHATLRNKGIAEDIGFNDEVDGYNSTFHKEFASTLGLNDEVGGENVVSEQESTSNLGFADTIGVNLESIAEATSEIGFSDEAYANIAQYDRELSHTLGFDDAVYGGLPGAPDMEVETLGLADDIDADYYPAKGIDEGIGFNAEAFKVWQYEVHAESTLGFDDYVNGENAGDLLFQIPSNLYYKFYLTVTGANDSLDDYYVTNLKTVQFRMKRGTMASNVIVSAIHSTEAEAAINARQNGTLVLDMASEWEGVELIRETMIEVDFNDVRYDIGSSSASMTLTGFSVLTYNTDVVYLDNVTQQKTNQDGRVSYRFNRPNYYVRPGYKVVFGQENFIVDEVALLFGDNFFYMDLYFDSDTLSGSNDFDIYKRYYVSATRERKFYATLTGTQDGESDYLFAGVQDIQVRLSSGRPSYVSVTVQHSTEVYNAIGARPNGDIRIDVIDGIDASLTEFTSVNFNEVSYSLLATSRTATLVGYRTTGYSSALTYSPEYVTDHRVQTDGKVFVRTIAPNLSVTPGWTISYGGYEFMAGEVSFNFQAHSQQMNISNTINIDTENHVEIILGLTGQPTSNTFYPVNSESIFGMKGEPHVSINDVEIAYDDSEGLGFTDYVVAELNP